MARRTPVAMLAAEPAADSISGAPRELDLSYRHVESELQRRQAKRGQPP